MSLKKPRIMQGVLSLSILIFCHNLPAQTTAIEPVPKVGTISAPNQDVRQLQGDEFLIDTAYLEDDSEFQHKLSYERTRNGEWSANFTEEITLVRRKHQIMFSLPANLAASGTERSRGLRDAEIEYSYGLFGDNSSRVTFSPGLGLSVPIGSFRKGLGSGGVSFSFKTPVSIMLSDRFASNSIFEMTYTRSAKNPESDKANTLDYEVGQSFVWFAKPRFNIFVETVWERSQEVAGQKLTETEYELLVSPAVRWRHSFKNWLTVSPGVAVPIGLGPSRGRNHVTFFIAFGHPVRREED